jgi:hypothetical protein
MVSGPDGPLPDSPSFRAVSAAAGRAAAKGQRGPRENDDARTGPSHRGRNHGRPLALLGRGRLLGGVAEPAWVPIALYSQNGTASPRVSVGWWADRRMCVPPAAFGAGAGT